MGEKLTIKGSDFEIVEIRPKGMNLKLLKRGINNNYMPNKALVRDAIKRRAREFKRYKEKQMTTDPELIKKYDQVYQDGEDGFFTFDSKEEQDKILELVDFNNKSVLEIGCGTGDMAVRIADAGAKYVDAIDVSREAIKAAVNKNTRYNLKYRICDLYSLPPNQYDVVVMIGVLEHVENPAEFLDTILTRFTTLRSTIATSSPCFLNPRGYVWMALQMLFKTQMSLTDKHFIHPWWMERWSEMRGCDICMDAVDQSWAWGQRLLDDFNIRLRKALPYLPDEYISDFIDFLAKDLSWVKRSKYGMDYFVVGANMVYILKK